MEIIAERGVTARLLVKPVVNIAVNRTEAMQVLKSEFLYRYYLNIFMTIQSLLCHGMVAKFCRKERHTT